jgi:hypothetical protein
MKVWKARGGNEMCTFWLENFRRMYEERCPQARTVVSVKVYIKN